MLSSHSVWIIGAVATGGSVLAAAVSFAYYSYLRGKLPLAVKQSNLEDDVLKLESEALDLREEKEREQHELAKVQQEKRQIELDVREARAWLEKHREEVDKLPEIKRDIERTKKRLEEVRSQLGEAKEELKDSRAERQEAVGKAIKARRAEEVAEKSRDRFEKEAKDLEERVEDLKEKRHQVKSQLQKLERQEEKAREKLRDLNQEAEDISKRRDQLDSELSEKQNRLRQVKAETEDKITRADLLESRIQSLQKTAEQAAVQVDGIAHMNEPPEVEIRLQDFMRPVITPSEENRKNRSLRGSNPEKKAFTEFTNHVEEAGFVFPSRTLRAFHTSLKISDISPLVVLAGISGTGKSQLPRLYAEAMGIHFLNVSVQPRWDAPQDLFGFYNYMEDRYKATELSRALRQMDFRNWPAQEEDSEDLQDLQKTVQDGMLLVLLDEMNLARVEYYFSELLSKLEMRPPRGVDNPEKRRDSEIEIELGSLDQREHPGKLYVGHNVLFAGTMNEDETTQALSDKVIDRSNVLRFGKPDEMRSRPRVDMPDAQPGYLKRDDWNAWCTRRLSDAERDRLHEVCEKVNEALMKINRPFGYRVQQAIEAYVAHYPRWGGDWFDNAVADQMEQKIIPKLRGVSRDIDTEAEDTLNEIEDVIRTLNDDRLMEAYEMARKRPVFQWAGVNREVD